jgi:ubiquinone/menaquinone biosynthesis C-methylase UbiE
VSTEYVEDVPYVRHFIPELSPQQLRLVAALNGLTPPSGEDFDYCELGCAHADTLCALAAAHPDGRFLGIDINAEHIASAKRLARDGGLDNIGFLQRDFGQLLDDDIGEFDFMVAYGVLSWVSPEKRSALIDLACAKLKPGGLLFVSYNAMPGWGAVEPLRQLLLSPPGGASGEGTLERAQRGFAFAKAMEQAGAEYFKDNPSASNMLTTMTKAGLSYVVHEYMHEHWTPMYFARVAWEMAARDLRFVGVLPPHLNFRDTAIAAALEPVLGNTDDRLKFESLRDFANNEFFRRDVYVKGPTQRSTVLTSAWLDETTWIAPSDGPGKRTVTLPHRELELDDLTFRISGILAERAASIADLAERPELAHVSMEELRASIRQLIVVQYVIPMKAKARRSGGGARYAVASSYNQMMIRRGSTDRPIILTSSVAGTGFPISALDALALRVLTEVAPDDRTQWTHDFVARSVLRLRVGEQVIEDDADQRRAIGEAVEAASQRLEKLVELGLLASR